MNQKTQYSIKKGNNYALPFLYKKDLVIISLFDYLMANGLIQNQKIIDVANQIKSLCTTCNGSYYFSFIHLNIQKKPLAKDTYSLEEVEESYPQILAFQKLFKVLLKEVSKHSAVIHQVTNHMMQKYFNFELINQALIEFPWALNQEQQKNYFNLNFLKSNYFYFDNPFNDPFKPILNVWKGVLNEQGKINSIESIEPDVPYFKETVYVLYGTHRWRKNGKNGYMQNQHNDVGGLSNARFYQTVESAKKQNHMQNPIIVEAKIVFNRIAYKDEGSDTTELDAFIATEEKEKLERQETKETLAQKLLELVGENESLKLELEKLLSQKEESQVKRKKI